MEKENYHTPDEDSLLNRLTKASREESPSDFRRPDDVDITAYLMGTASDNQNRVVRRALEQSEAFRREMLQMASDIEALTETPPDSLQEPTETTETPTYNDFLMAREKPAPARKVTGETPGEKIVRLLTPRFYIPAAVAAAAVVALMFLTQPSLDDISDMASAPAADNWEPVAQALDPGYLVGQRVRGQAPVTGAYTSAREAALAGFRELLVYQGGEFDFVALDQRPMPPSESVILNLIMIDPNGGPILDERVDIPVVVSGVPDSVTAWALTLPERDLYNFVVTSDTLLIQWAEAMGRRGCITFTYKDTDGHHAILGYTFELM